MGFSLLDAFCEPPQLASAAGQIVADAAGVVSVHREAGTIGSVSYVVASVPSVGQVVSPGGRLLGQSSVVRSLSPGSALVEGPRQTIGVSSLLSASFIQALVYGR